MSRVRAWLLVVLAFNSISAVGGGVAVMTGALPFPLSWLRQTPFSSYFIPGLVLLLVVGGSAAIAALAVGLRRWCPIALAALSGVIMVGWIVSEVLLIRTFSPLQVLYLATGILVLVLAPRALRGAVPRRG